VRNGGFDGSGVLLDMRSLVNEYSFIVILIIVMIVPFVVFLRFGGVLRWAALVTGCLLMLASVFLLAWNRSSDRIYYSSAPMQGTLPPLMAPAVIQFYSNY